MLVVGLTGGIATGKSTVARMFVEQGVRLVDLDRIARVVVEPGTPALRRLAREFGNGILAPDGSLDRPALARKVFSDPALRKRLEGILHPFIEQEMFRRIEEAAREDLDALVMVDIPLLFEAGWENKVDTVVLVYAPASLQMERLMARDGLSEEEAVKRLAAQWPVDEKIARSDFVIRNTGSLEDTRSQVRSVFRELKKRAEARPRPEDGSGAGGSQGDACWNGCV